MDKSSVLLGVLLELEDTLEDALELAREDGGLCPMELVLL